MSTQASALTFSRKGAALVNGDLLWHIVQVDGAFQEPPGRSAISRLAVENLIVPPSRPTAVEIFHWPKT
jgi:hypothetical protein